MSEILAVLAVGALLGAVVVFPIAYAMGSEAAHRATGDAFRTLRNRRIAP
jgi:hypothetical protein